MPPLIPLAQVIYASEVHHAWRIFAPVLFHLKIMINISNAGGLHQSDCQLENMAIAQNECPDVSLRIADASLSMRNNRKKSVEVWPRPRHQPDGSADQSQGRMEALEAVADGGGTGGAGVVGSRMARCARRW
jgi:hypothetical protein